MLFNDHSDLRGQHAFLSASKYHWINYDDEKLERTFVAQVAAQKGTDLHAFAHEAIRLGVRQSKSPKTLNMYVNDALGFRMVCEQMLYVSPNAFGTPDTMCFRNNKLRIHDLKTGLIPCSVHQLEVYSAFFCLEYRHRPQDIEIELRIYQNDEVRVFEADPDVIQNIMYKIVAFDKRITQLRLEAMS